MSHLWAEIKAKIQGLLGNWAAISALGSFLLYLFGYLALRFHLTTLGIGTDLSVLDERYLFTGAKFLIYLLTSIPILFLIGLPVAFVVWQVRKAFDKPNSRRPRAESSFLQKLSTPSGLALLALVISVLVIQFVMRQCFFFGNLLLAPALPNTLLNLHLLLFDEAGGWRSLYFSGLVAATIGTFALLWYGIYRSRTVVGAKPIPRLLLIVVSLLIGIQFLLLPVNYGVFILEKQIPKVTDLGGDQTTLNPNQEAWLVWEGNEGRTYLIQTTTEQQKERRLVTVPRKDFKKIEITRYDEIIKYLFDP